MSKIALIGTGKTGRTIVDLVPAGDLVGPFNTKNAPTVQKLEEADVIIVFVTGPVMEALIPLLLQTKKPVISGATNVMWPQDLEAILKKQNILWVRGFNFSVGAYLQHVLGGLLSQTLSLWGTAEVSLLDRHHQDKKDAPSGTGKNLMALFGEKNVRLYVEREADVVGLHRLRIETPFERLDVTHEVFDRHVYAQGALWAAREILSGDYGPGLLNVEDMMAQKSKELL